MTEELLPCPFCGASPCVFNSLQTSDHRLKHTCRWFTEPFVIEWCRLERLVRLWNTRDLGISTDYEEIRKQCGAYWVRGVLEGIPAAEWRMMIVANGKWWYFDGTGCNEIDKGEWIFIPHPQSGDS